MLCWITITPILNSAKLILTWVQNALHPHSELRFFALVKRHAKSARLTRWRQLTLIAVPEGKQAVQKRHRLGIPRDSISYFWPSNTEIWLFINVHSSSASYYFPISLPRPANSDQPIDFLITAWTYKRRKKTELSWFKFDLKIERVRWKKNHPRRPTISKLQTQSHTLITEKRTKSKNCCGKRRLIWGKGWGLGVVGDMCGVGKVIEKPGDGPTSLSVKK